MMKIVKYTLLTALTALWFTSWAQIEVYDKESSAAISEEEPHVFDCYQTFFIDNDLESVEKVKVDGKEIQFEYIPDKKQLILHDYKGKGKIECTGRNSEGEHKEYSKSPCYIDPCENAL
ncbi:MAG: hypothetical protein HKN92_00240 [Chitinophagales bacterium]|nr:hypothetical protein [Chitinophagales bacterium]